MSELKDKTAKGLLWGGLGNGVMQLLNLLFGIFLSRMLSPGDYGVVGALTIFSALAGILSESGFILAIVNRKEVTEIYYNSVFWFNVAMSMTIYAVLWFCAPLIAGFYRQPEMVGLSRFIFTGFVFSALASTPTAYFFRSLNVEIRSKIQITALAVSGIAGVYCAFVGLGYWAIAVQTVLYTAVNSSLLWITCPLRPRFQFSLTVLKQMLPFSIKQLTVSVFTQFNNNIFSVLLGRFYGMRPTGFYTQGNKWTSMGSGILTGMLTGVGQPVLRQTVDDPERLRRVFRRLLRFTALLSFPAMFGLALVSREVIVLLITDKWLDSVRVMQILCIGGAFLPIATLYGNLFNSIGRPGVYMWNVIALGLTQTLFLCITYNLGLQTMLLFYASVNVAWTFVWQFFARRYAGLRFREAFTDILPYLIMSAAVMVVTGIITAGIGNSVLLLAVRIILVVSFYSLSIRLMRPEEFEEAVNFIWRRKNES